MKTNPEQARCCVCSHEFVPPPQIVAAIRGVDGTDLSLQCLDCQPPLQLNPFSRLHRFAKQCGQVGAAKDYADVLRRGLDFSRSQIGADHEEALAHLAALSVHCEQLGQPEAARPFAEEHARLIALIAQPRKAEH